MNSSSGTGPGGGALNNPSSGKIDQQRKILEELERQKKLLNKGNVAASTSASAPGSAAPASASSSSSAAAAATSPGPLSLPPGAALQQQDPSSPNSPLLSANQRSALEAAAKTSFGYFIAQDSSFGNTILPVIPRMAPPAGGK